MASSFQLPQHHGAGRRRSSAAAMRPPVPPPQVYIPPTIGDVTPPGPSLPPSAYPSTVDMQVFQEDEEEEIGTRPPSFDVPAASGMPGLAAAGAEAQKVRFETFNLEHEGERELASLPPVDRGKGAWSFLIAGTVVETIVWGLPWSVGVLHNYWAHEMFPESESTLTLAATLQTGFMYMTAALIGPVFTALPQWTKQAQYIGLVVATIGLIASAFVTSASHLVITIGILYPFAGATYLPCATMLYDWFQDRRGMATGIMFAGTGIGGTVYPFVVTALLKRFGYKATMISLGISFGLLNGVALLFIKRRIPLGRVGERKKYRSKMDWSFLTQRGVWTGIAIILMTAMGNFIPSLWIPTYAEQVRATKPNGTALVALMNAASVPGNTLTGYLSDKYPSRVVIPFSCCLASLSCLLLWGFGTSDALLVAFSVVWGMTALSFVGTWSKMITIISKDDPRLPTFHFSLFTVLKGVGNLTSGPISTGLLSLGAMTGAKGAYGATNYGSLLIYTGVTTFIAGVPALFFPTK